MNVNIKEMLLLKIRINIKHIINKYEKYKIFKIRHDKSYNYYNKKLIYISKYIYNI